MHPVTWAWGRVLDAYPVESFVGPLKAFDASNLDSGRTVTADMLRKLPIVAGDVVIMYTDYAAPTNDSDLPQTIALSYEAAEYLATLPIRAFGTDAWSVASLTDQSPVASDDPVAQTIPAHYALLSRGHSGLRTTGQCRQAVGQGKHVIRRPATQYQGWRLAW